MSQEFVTELDENEAKLNREIDNLLDGVDFQQPLTQEKSPVHVPCTFPEEDRNNCMEVDNNDRVDNSLNGIDFDQSLSQEKSPLCIPSTFPEENGITQTHDEDMYTSENISSPVLFTQKEDEKTDTSVVEGNGLSAGPIIQPFTCSEEKSPVHYDDPMDTLEEKPITDVGDTYLSDKAFNQKYPQHPIDVSMQTISVTLYTCNSQYLLLYH